MFFNIQNEINRAYRPPASISNTTKVSKNRTTKAVYKGLRKSISFRENKLAAANFLVQDGDGFWAKELFSELDDEETNSADLINYSSALQMCNMFDKMEEVIGRSR